MINLLCSGLFMMLLLSGCGWNGTPTRHNDFVPLTSIQIVPDDPSIASTIAFGTSIKLKAIGNFSGQFTRDISSEVAWTSDTPTVAEFIISAIPSRVSSHIAGVATLTATKGSVSATFKLTVTPATISTVTITPAAPTIAKGLKTQFAASGTFSDGTTQDLTFDATWVSIPPAVATVSDDPASKGFAQALAAGTATISATFDGLPGTTLMTVTEPVLQSITVLPANPTVLSLSSKSFTATGNFSDGTTPDITSQVAWSSSQPTIATINAASGASTALLPGTTSISATLNGVSGTSNLKVTGGTLTAITLIPAAPRLVQGTIGQITATGTFDNGTTRDITGVVQWSVANTSFATVATPGGNLAFVKAISATPALAPTLVSATSGTITSSNTPNLTVVNPTLNINGLTVTPAGLDLTGGTSGRFTVTGAFSDGSSQDLTASANWSSNASAIATVGNTADDTDLSKGRVKGVATGSATISAGFGGQTAPPVNVINNVTVTARTLLSLSSITGGPTSFVPGNQSQFRLTASFNGATQDVTEDADWSIDNPNIAILADKQNQPGQVVLVDRGTATLTATFGGKTQTFTITVP